ncbi:MAG: acyl-CoA/acyl-ACP dehydrogenase [Sphingomonadales bacterium]|nr:acyl-CoA/acyl-ACP dehydrogenase [Sphingomonadales bacterium]
MDTTTALDQFATLVAASAVDTDRDGRFPTALAAAFLASGLAGLLSATDVGGSGGSVRDAAAVVERLARACGSTAMIVKMHYSAAGVIEAFGNPETRKAVATGQALATLAFSEAGSRSHFWAPLSTATRDGDDMLLDARKSWITAANGADLYVWSSQGTTGQGASIWLVPRRTPGIDTSAPFDGLGLRGNDSAPATATAARIPAANLLGQDGNGADVMLGTVLPVFATLNACAALGIMSGAVEKTIAHATATGFQHLGQRLADLPTIRAYIARMQIKTDMVRALIGDTLDALESPSEVTMLRVLEAKAAAGECATEVTDLAMRVCGGAAFRKEAGVERAFRDARANTVMAPTTDQLYDFIGRALCGIDLFA